jgi:hypothetical protein
MSAEQLSRRKQYVCVDPLSKLVMVQTAVEAPDYDEKAWALWSAPVDQFG